MGHRDLGRDPLQSRRGGDARDLHSLSDGPNRCRIRHALHPHPDYGGDVGFVLARILETTGLSGIDRLAGLLFGVARGVLILTVGVFLARSTPFPKEPTWQASQLIPVFQSLAIWMEAQVPPGFVPRLGEKSLSH